MERRGDGMTTFPCVTWSLTFLLPNVPEAVSLFPLYLLCHFTSDLLHGPLVSSLPCMKNASTSSQTSAY